MDGRRETVITNITFKLWTVENVLNCYVISASLYGRECWTISFIDEEKTWGHTDVVLEKDTEDTMEVACD